jgi:wobble nucleotide-excising tRNase
MIVKHKEKLLVKVSRQKKEAKRKLETQQQDESKGAEQVNLYLEKIGHSGFKLVAEGEKPNIKFKIIRDGEQAKNLSDGEASLISFCYFMATIKDKLDTNTSIYIDDPISSLDNNHIFFMFSLIDTEISKPKKFQQLFISTHNLDFLKYLKRLSISKPEKNLEHFLIESANKLNDRRSFIKKMPLHLKVYVTEFNYLFNELYSYYLQIENGGVKPEESYNQFYNLPNNMRKFLEYYLFYKFPNNDNPLKNLGKLFDDEVPSLLNRVINELSHLTHIDRGWSPIDVSEAEECVKIIIEKVKEKDKEQFNALLESIKGV